MRLRPLILGTNEGPGIWITSGWNSRRQETVMGWLDLNVTGKGRTQTSHQQDQSARFPGNITQTQKFLRIFRGAKGLFAFQWVCSERPGKFLALLSHWKARPTAMKKRQHPWSSFMKSQEKGPLGHFNCLILGYRDKTKGIRPWQNVTENGSKTMRSVPVR